MSLDTTVQQAIENGTIPGAVLLATNTAGSFTYQSAAGKRTLQPGADDPLQLNSIFAIASMTKLLTTICALQLVERGVVGLDDDVTSHIPVLANQPILVGLKDDGTPILERRRNDITLRHLLTHSAGTGYALAEPKLLQYLQHEGRKPMEGNTIDEIFNYPLMYQPGDGWSYGSGVTWAGKVVESLSGKSLEECIQENIFKPLGLSRVTFSPDQVPSMAGQVCDLHHREEATGSLVPIGPALPYFKSTDHLGGEGAFADLTEFFKVMESLLRDDGKLLKSETAKLMFEPQLPSDEARAALKAAVESPEWQAMGDFSGPKEYAWAFGGILVAGDGHPFRKRGCLIWGGAPNQFWAGICALFGTTVFPPADVRTGEVISAFEKHVYAEAAKAAAN